LSLFNKDKKRIEILKNGKWLLIDFFYFQYGKKLNCNNRVHQSILNIYIDNEVNLTSIRGLEDFNDSLKDKDKDKDKDIKKKEFKEIHNNFMLKKFSQENINKNIWQISKERNQITNLLNTFMTKYNDKAFIWFLEQCERDDFCIKNNFAPSILIGQVGKKMLNYNNDFKEKIPEHLRLNK
jgi:hypothetical protein